MEKLTSKQATCLRWFSSGHHIDLCIDICNQLGRFFPSEPFGQLVKQNQIQALFIRGLLSREFTEISGICYWRFTVNESGQQCFEEYKNACSK